MVLQVGDYVTVTIRVRPSARSALPAHPAPPEKAWIQLSQPYECQAVSGSDLQSYGRASGSALDLVVTA